MPVRLTAHMHENPPKLQNKGVGGGGGGMLLDTKFRDTNATEVKRT